MRPSRSPPKFTHEYLSLKDMDRNSCTSMNVFEVSDFMVKDDLTHIPPCGLLIGVFYSGLWRATSRHWRVSRVTWTRGTAAVPPRFTTPPPKATSGSSTSSYGSPAHRVRHGFTQGNDHPSSFLLSLSAKEKFAGAWGVEELCQHRCRPQEQKLPRMHCDLMHLSFQQ